MYNRLVFNKIFDRIKEPRSTIQVLLGPRQVGKTTIVLKAAQESGLPLLWASADEPTLKTADWLEEQWLKAHDLMQDAQGAQGALLVIDEIQKVNDWSEKVKLLWDKDTRQKKLLKVILLGSSSTLIQEGLSESLAGRFEIIPVTHWSYSEMKDAFGFTLPQYIYFGGYPGAAALISDEKRWKSYIRDSLIETTVSRDVLLHHRVDKPALLRQLFGLACHYSGQILSYQKMLGQLFDAGNATTLAHYLDLLSKAGLVSGLQKHILQMFRQKASSPKLQVHNTALMSAGHNDVFESVYKQGELWGRWVESAVGAHLVNLIRNENSGVELFYWNDGIKEVDFVLRHGNKLVGIEVKSGKKRTTSLIGLNAWKKLNPHARTHLIGGAEGVPLEEFFTSTLDRWI